MPFAKPRNQLRKTLLGVNTNIVAPGGTVDSMSTADQEVQIKKVMISGGADQGATCAFILIPPGTLASETSALKPEYAIYRFGIYGTAGIIDFMDKPAIRVPEGWSFGLVVHNYSLSNMDTLVQCVVWHYAV